MRKVLLSSKCMRNKRKLKGKLPDGQQYLKTWLWDVVVSLRPVLDQRHSPGWHPVARGREMAG